MKISQDSLERIKLTVWVLAKKFPSVQLLLAFESQQFEGTNLEFDDLTISSPVMYIVLILIKLASLGHNLALSAVDLGKLQEGPKIQGLGNAVEAG